jgi:hypothetical protein
MMAGQMPGGNPAWRKEVGIRSKTWRLIDTGVGSAGWNMALDEALLKNFSKDARTAEVRLCPPHERRRRSGARK